MGATTVHRPMSWSRNVLPTKSVPSKTGLGRDEVGSGRTGSEAGSSNGKRRSGK